MNPNQSEKLLAILKNTIAAPIEEMILGIERGVVPWLPISVASMILNIFWALGFSQLIFEKYYLSNLLPNTFMGNCIYVVFQWLFVLYLWSIYRTLLRRRLTFRLKELFSLSGLKTPTGKFPSIVYDQPIDEWTRKLRLKRLNFPKESFVKAKSYFESGLQIYVDEVRENRESGTVDFIYSHEEMPKVVTLESFILSKEAEFNIGKTRSKMISVNFNDVPHLLIGGQTGGGKSTFLRQLITSLYMSNSNYSFYLIDLKGGLEFQLFENLPRVQVLPNAKRALETLKTMEKTLEHRFSILKLNQVKDLSAFNQIPEAKRKYPNSVPEFFKKVTRTIIVIDEAAELFMAGDLNKSNDVQEARKLTAKIAAQGRAVGLHLIIATQKPDVRAIDSHIKTNLTGIISFQMPNLGSSMSILSSGRAADLPSIPGRAIWKSGLDQLEIQTPFVNVEQVQVALKSYYQERKQEDQTNELEDALK